MAMKFTLNFSELDPRTFLAFKDEVHQPKHILIQNVGELRTRNGLRNAAVVPSRKPIIITATWPNGGGALSIGIRTQGWRRE